MVLYSPISLSLSIMSRFVNMVCLMMLRGVRCLIQLISVTTNSVLYLSRWQKSYGQCLRRKDVLVSSIQYIHYWWSGISNICIQNLSRLSWWEISRYVWRSWMMYMRADSISSIPHIRISMSSPNMVLSTVLLCFMERLIDISMQDIDYVVLKKYIHLSHDIANSQIKRWENHWS